MRTYSIIGQNITISGSPTLAYLQPASGQTVEIIRAWVSQSGTTTSAQLAVSLNFKATAFPTLTSATPTPVQSSDPISLIVGGTAGAAGTSGINASAEGAGALTLKYADNFNNLVGWLWTPSFSGGESIFLNSAAAVSYTHLTLPTNREV